MRPYSLALILIAASLSGCLEGFDHEGVFMDCDRVVSENNTTTSSSNYEKRECEVIDNEDQDYNRSKKPNKTGTGERKDEDNPSNTENAENTTRES